MAPAKRGRGKAEKPPRRRTPARGETERYRRRTAEALQELGKRFRSVVQSASDAIVLVDAHGAIRLWNAAAERLFGWSDHEAVGAAFSMLFAEPGRADVEEGVRQCIARGESAGHGTFEVTAVDRAGREIPVETALSGFASGRSRFATAIVRDVRERKEAEERIRRALARAKESDRLKSAFLANVSHEIRTPINVIVGTATILADHLREVGDHSQDAAVEAMHRSGKRLVDAIGRVLDYSRLSSGELALRPTRVRLRSLVETETGDLAPLAKEKGLDLACEVIDANLAVYADRRCLSRALGNLIDNAIKFTERGSVRVRVTRDVLGQVVIEVEDTGVGIEPWFHDRLFDPFTQEETGDRRSYEGQGLGLAVARRYVELVGGTIEMKSEKGRGSRFRIHLPAPARPAPPREGATIVVAREDEKEPSWLAALGERFDLRCERSADGARRALEENRARAAGLVLSLGLGEPAFALGHALREDPWWWDLPIVGVLGAGEAWGRGRAIAAGIDEVTDARDGAEIVSRLLERLP